MNNQDSGVWAYITHFNEILTAAGLLFGFVVSILRFIFVHGRVTVDNTKGSGNLYSRPYFGTYIGSANDQTLSQLIRYEKTLVNGRPQIRPYGFDRKNNRLKYLGLMIQLFFLRIPFLADGILKP